MKKSIVALAASTLLIGMSLSALPAFADDAPAGDQSSQPAKPAHAKSHKHHSSKKSKKSDESSSAAPK